VCVELLIPASLRKKMRYVEMKRDVDDCTKGNIRQVICRKYSKGKICAVK
jgi:hypothetical protein